MRAFVHCRVSTQEQGTDDHCSLANQEARCHDYIKQRRWKLVKVLRDVGSGKSDERDSYQELLRAIREKRVDVTDGEPRGSRDFSTARRSPPPPG